MVVLASIINTNTWYRVHGASINSSQRGVVLRGTIVKWDLRFTKLTTFRYLYYENLFLFAMMTRTSGTGTNSSSKSRIVVMSANAVVAVCMLLPPDQ